MENPIKSIKSTLSGLEFSWNSSGLMIRQMNENENDSNHDSKIICCEWIFKYHRNDKIWIWLFAMLYVYSKKMLLTLIKRSLINKCWNIVRIRRPQSRTLNIRNAKWLFKFHHSNICELVSVLHMKAGCDLSSIPCAWSVRPGILSLNPCAFE